MKGGLDGKSCEKKKEGKKDPGTGRIPPRHEKDNPPRKEDRDQEDEALTRDGEVEVTHVESDGIGGKDGKEGKAIRPLHFHHRVTESTERDTIFQRIGRY